MSNGRVNPNIEDELAREYVKKHQDYFDELFDRLKDEIHSCQSRKYQRKSQDQKNW